MYRKRISSVCHMDIRPPGWLRVAKIQLLM